MNTLIIYATKYGCTEKCATILAGKLSGEITLYNLKERTLPDINQYDRISIGGSVYYGNIQKEVAKFCWQNQAILKEKKIGLFICGLQTNMAEALLSNAFPSDLLSKAVVKEFFGGEVRLSKLNTMDKRIAKIVTKGNNHSHSLAFSPIKDTSIIFEDTINKFALLMNNA